VELLGNCWWSLRNLGGALCDLFHELRGKHFISGVRLVILGFQYVFCVSGALAYSHCGIGAYVICCLYRMPQEIEMIATDITGG